MKNLVLLMLICVSAMSATAQKVTNNSRCQVNIVAGCYNISTCASTPCSTITVPPVTGPVGLPVCSCGANEKPGYAVCCYPAPPPNTNCAKIDNGWNTGPCFPPSVTLNCCTPSITVTWVGGDMYIN
jgi:hypothetical protein